LPTTLQGEELAAILRERAERGAELRIVAPILVSRIRYIASDVDRELRETHERLTAALASAHDAGLEVSGKVSDPHVALGAIEDEPRLFAADEVVISTYPPGKSNWLETGIIERLREELDIPVTHVIANSIPLDGGRAVGPRGFALCESSRGSRTHRGVDMTPAVGA